MQDLGDFPFPFVQQTVDQVVTMLYSGRADAI